MKILVAGGGTGGHITPNIAIIEKIKLIEPQAEILYVGAKGGMEENMIKEKGWSFRGISCGKLRRYFSWENFWDLFRTIWGIGQSLWIVLKFKPKVIFCKGGYVSFPVAVAGGILRKPVIIHESDAEPGLANKLAAKFAREICVSFEETKDIWPRKNTILTGNPVREELKQGKKEKGFEITGLKKGKPVIMVMGGSQGAGFINELIWHNLPKLLDSYQVIHLCGKGKEKQELKGKWAEYFAVEFASETLKDMLAITDLMISRAGANSLAEIAYLGIPAILIPLVLGSRGDQIKNAEIFAKNYPAVVLNERELFPEKLDLMAIIRDLEKRPKPNKNTSNAAEKIAQLIIKYDY